MNRTLKKVLWLTLTLAILLATMLPALGTAEAISTESSAGGIKFSRKTLILYVGERYDMPSFLLPKKAGATLDTSRITWKSSKSSVVTISKKSGLAIGMKPGTATITATTKSKKKATIKLIVKRNKIDKIYGGKPSLSYASYRDYELLLKSVEITKPDTVVCEYYLVFNYPRNYKSTYFSRFDATISAYDTYYESTETIVDGSPSGTVRVSCRGQQVKVFKVTFRGGSVYHTDIALPKSGRSSFSDNWDVYLNWNY